MDHIIGQDRAIGLLRRQLSTARLHHAFIFHGQSGVGKFTTALAFAKILLCHQPVKDGSERVAACDACKSCQMLRSIGQATALSGEAASDDDAKAEAAAPLESELLALANPHPDLHIITKELARFSDDSTIRGRKLTQIPVQVVDQHLIGPAHQAPQAGSRKVFVLDEAELLNATGQNRLLKTLEEPPEDTTIILVTSSEEKLLPTIRSRCMRVGFTPLEDDRVQQWVQQRAAEAGVELTPNKLNWLVRFAQGSLGRAELALTYDLASWAAQILPAVDGMTKARLDGELGGRMAQLINGFAQDWVERHDEQAKAFAQLIEDKDAGGKLTSKEAANRLASDLMWSMLASHARLRMRQAMEDLPAHQPDQAERKLEPWLGVVEALDEARRLVGSNVNLSLVCDHLVLQIARTLARARK